MTSIPRLRLKEPGGGSKGALQPPGRDQRTARSIREWAYRSGMMPQVFLLKIMRGETIDGYEPTFRDRFDAAVQCVRYFAPSMKSVEIKNEDTVVQTSTLTLDPTVLDRMTEDELIILKRAITKLHTGVDADRSGKRKEEARETYKATIYH